MRADEYLNLVRECRCVICWHRLGVLNIGCHPHHVGTGDEHNDFATAALCYEHHQGATGVHGLHRRPFERFWKVTNVILIAWTMAEVMRDR